MEPAGISRHPDWVKWKLHPDVMLWQAVALWLDIDPDRVRINRSSMGGVTLSRFDVHQELE